MDLKVAVFVICAIYFVVTARGAYVPVVAARLASRGSTIQTTDVERVYLDTGDSSPKKTTYDAIFPSWWSSDQPWYGMRIVISSESSSSDSSFSESSSSDSSYSETSSSDSSSSESSSGDNGSIETSSRVSGEDSSSQSSSIKSNSSKKEKSRKSQEKSMKG